MQICPTHHHPINPPKATKYFTGCHIVTMVIIIILFDNLITYYGDSIGDSYNWPLLSLIIVFDRITYKI